jgi:hypothetical protein
MFAAAAAAAAVLGVVVLTSVVIHGPAALWSMLGRPNAEEAFYAATKIDTSAGERWFCSEGQVRAAGW